MLVDTPLWNALMINNNNNKLYFNRILWIFFLTLLSGFFNCKFFFIKLNLEFE